MKLYKTLEKKQKNHRALLKNSEDVIFYNANKHLMASIPMYKPLLSPETELDIIRANIIIRAIQNKKKLEDMILYAFKESTLKTEEIKDYIHEQMTGLPYLKDGNKKIYVPIFSRSINEFYYEDFGKLLVRPYSSLFTDFSQSCIDLFEFYKFNLYDSLFTKLVTVYRDEKCLVMYHYDFRTIYFINDQGRLDAKIALFDKHIKHPKFAHISERIQPVVQAYLNGTRDDLYKALIDNELISKKLITSIRIKEWLSMRSIFRKL